MSRTPVRDSATASARTNSDSERIRVLLVDDDEDSYVITKNLLAEVENADIELDWAPSFDAGLKVMRQVLHDAYLVDYHIGARDGLDLHRQARAQGCVAPVIILTGQGDHAIDLREEIDGRGRAMGLVVRVELRAERVTSWRGFAITTAAPRSARHLKVALA